MNDLIEEGSKWNPLPLKNNIMEEGGVDETLLIGGECEQVLIYITA